MAHLESFFVWPLLHSLSYAPTFYQIKDLIKIYICGKFHQYNVCACEGNIFQSFSYWFSIHEMALFGGVLGPYSPKYCSNLPKFWPEVVFKLEKDIVWKILQNFEFWLKWNAPKVYAFGPFWGPIYHRKTKNIAWNQNFCKNYILRNIKQRKSQVPEKSQNSCKIKPKKQKQIFVKGLSEIFT